MKNKILLLLIVSALVISLSSCDFIDNLFGGGSDKEITVFSGGETEYTFVTADGASKDIVNLTNSLATLSGGAISTDTAPEGAKEILIGETNRAASADIKNKLNETISAITFQYVIAEVDGKIVILAETDVGYVYALEYLNKKYIKDGTFNITAGTCDVQKVLWDEYYISDLYYDRLLEESENDNKPPVGGGTTGGGTTGGGTTGGGMMTMEQAIKDYQNKIAAFDSTDFGTYTPKTFTSASTRYKDPTVYPPEGVHPSILFTPNTIDEVRENIMSAQSKKAYDKYIALSDSSWDGKYASLSGTTRNNYDGAKTAIMEAKAFRYAMTGEKIYGYEAIYAAKNAILTIDVTRDVGDYCRTYGHLMYVVACVYDWCYDLLTDLDKQQLIAGNVLKLGYMQEVVSQSNLNNYLPTGQGAAYGHGAEDQLVTDYLAFAIACYDEAPEIYDVVAGRILSEHVPMQNYLGQSGGFWAEGSMYASCRGVASMVSNLLFNKMTDGAVSPYTYLQAAITSSTYYIRPDGQFYRIGDVNENKSASNLQWFWMANNCLYAGNLYNDPYLKTVAYQYLSGFNSFTNCVAGLSVCQFLAVNDPDVACDYDMNNAPLTYTTTYPYTTLFVKSENNSKDAFGLYMSMQEMFAPSHGHAEAGSFQIFYKGALVSDSGAYSSWGDNHYFGYQMSSIAANTILVFNQNMAKEWAAGNFGKYDDYNKTTGPRLWYVGGQTLIPSYTPGDLTELLNHELLGQTQSLGNKSVEKDGKLVYTYMASDMTGAYDAVTVDEVTRYMITVATGNEECPYAVLTFDRVTSDDASYRKSALIHVQQEPTVTEDGYVIVTNTKGTNNGKLVLQNVGFGVDYTVVGGPGREFWVPGLDENGNYSLEDGKNIPHNHTVFDGSAAEYGWGRIEIVPETAAKTNHILTVMYVTDADSEAENVAAKALNSADGALTGSEIFGKAVFFPKNDKLLNAETSFTLDATVDTCYITGLDDGTWTIKKDGAVIDTVTVEGGRIIADIGTYADGEHVITFAAGAGTYTITPAN